MEQQQLQQQQLQGSTSSSPRVLAPAPQQIQGQKRGAPSGTVVAQDHPAKKQSKWSQQENALIIELRGAGMKWEDISKRLPGRSAISCRLHYQNFLERRAEWDEEKKNKLARLYERFKKEMWDSVAKELQMPWRAVEAMHWQLGSEGIAQRAGVPVFQTAQVPPTMPLAMTPSIAPACDPNSFDSPYNYSPRSQQAPSHMMHQPQSIYTTSASYAPLPPPLTTNGPGATQMEQSRAGSPGLRRSYSGQVASAHISPQHRRAGSLPRGDFGASEPLPYHSPSSRGPAGGSLVTAMPPTSHALHDRERLPPMRVLTESGHGNNEK